MASRRVHCVSLCLKLTNLPCYNLDIHECILKFLEEMLLRK